MQKKTKIIIFICAVVLLLVGCGITYFVITKEPDNKKSDNTASSTDSVIENTDIASLDYSESSEITTTEANTINSASGGIETESSNAIKDDDTTDNDNKPNNEGNNGNVTTQTSGGNGGNTPATTEKPNNEDTKPETPATTEQPTTEATTTEEHTECQHNWTLVDETIYIEPVYETQTVCVQEAYDEPIYEWHSFCNGCGMDLTINFPDGHYISHTTVCQGGSTYHADKILVDTIHHDAVYETKEVLVSGGYSEIVTHTVCSICGYQIN